MTPLYLQFQRIGLIYFMKKVEDFKKNLPAFNKKEDYQFVKN